MWQTGYSFKKKKKVSLQKRQDEDKNRILKKMVSADAFEFMTVQCEHFMDSKWQQKTLKLYKKRNDVNSPCLGQPSIVYSHLYSKAGWDHSEEINTLIKIPNRGTKEKSSDSAFLLWLDPTI